MDRRTSTTRPVALSSPSITATTTVTIENSDPSSSSSQHEQQQPEVLFLPLTRKKVTWKEGTVDNEFLQKKSSKKCCIFHKQKPFDEDDSDEDDIPNHSDKHAHDHSDSGLCCKNHDEAGLSS